MPAFVAGLPSPVLRDFPLPAKVSMMPTAMTLLSIDDPSPQTAALMPSVAPISQAVARWVTEMTAERRRAGSLAQPPRRERRRAWLLDLPLLRTGLRFDGVRFMHRLLK